MVDAALEPGRVLAGKYRLGERLGEGGMGAVYRAEHLVLQAPVAIKVIEREVADEGTKSRFMREAQAAAALRSPHVVQILDYGTEDDFPFMVMELLEGETLARRIKRRGRLSPQETSWILAHVGRAVSKAHELGIVHRDLKPDNVFLVRNEEDEIAKVLDFGVAKIEATSLNGDSHTRTGSLLGTPYYMSPEQAQGNKAIDHRSDLWALGVIAFECVTGRRPFASDGLGDLVLQICIRDLPMPSDVAPVPIGFDAWFAKAMQREPDDRFQSAKELSDSLREALGVKDSPSAPDIIVTSAAASSYELGRTDEDARPTALEYASVDAAAETLAEEDVLLSELEEARLKAAANNSDPVSALSVSLGQGGPAIPLPELPAPGKRRSRAGLVLAVGSGALAVGALTAVLTLRDRPGFRVGDIEAPAASTSKRSSGASPQFRPKPAEEGRQPAHPRAKREETDIASTPAAETDAESTDRVIDGRSILEPIPEPKDELDSSWRENSTSKEGSVRPGEDAKGLGALEEKPRSGTEAPRSSTETKPPESKGTPTDEAPKSGDGKSTEQKSETVDPSAKDPSKDPKEENESSKAKPDTSINSSPKPSPANPGPPSSGRNEEKSTP